MALANGKSPRFSRRSPPPPCVSHSRKAAPPPPPHASSSASRFCVPCIGEFADSATDPNVLGANSLIHIRANDVPLLAWRVRHARVSPYRCGLRRRGVSRQRGGRRVVRAATFQDGRFARC